MGFNSDFKDSTASSRLAAVSGHFQVKLVVEYMQSLQDSMCGKSRGNKSSLVNSKLGQHSIKELQIATDCQCPSPVGTQVILQPRSGGDEVL